MCFSKEMLYLSLKYYVLLLTDRVWVFTPCNFVICMQLCTYVCTFVWLQERDADVTREGRPHPIYPQLHWWSVSEVRWGHSCCPSPALRRPQGLLFMGRLCTADLISPEWVVYQSWIITEVRAETHKTLPSGTTKMSGQEGRHRV